MPRICGVIEISVTTGKLMCAGAFFFLYLLLLCISYQPFRQLFGSEFGVCVWTGKAYYLMPGYVIRMHRRHWRDFTGLDGCMDVHKYMQHICSTNKITQYSRVLFHFCFSLFVALPLPLILLFYHRVLSNCCFFYLITPLLCWLGLSRQVALYIRDKFHIPLNISSSISLCMFRFFPGIRVLLLMLL